MTERLISPERERHPLEIKAQDYFLEGKIGKAFRTANKLLRKQPENPGASAVIARIAMTKDDFLSVTRYIANATGTQLARLTDRPRQLNENRMIELSRKGVKQMSTDEIKEFELLNDIVSYQKWREKNPTTPEDAEHTAERHADTKRREGTTYKRGDARVTIRDKMRDTTMGQITQIDQAYARKIKTSFLTAAGIGSLSIPLLAYSVFYGGLGPVLAPIAMYAIGSGIILAGLFALIYTIRRSFTEEEKLKRA